MQIEAERLMHTEAERLRHYEAQGGWSAMPQIRTAASTPSEGLAALQVPDLVSPKCESCCHQRL